MAASLNLTKARVTTPAGTHAAVTVRVRGSRAELLSGRTVLAEGEAVAVEVTARRPPSWRVTLADGTSWAVVAAKRGG